MAQAAPFIALAIAAIGTGVSIYSGVEQGQAQQRQAAYQSAVAHNNSVLAERAAKDAEARGEIDANQKAIDTRQLIGRQAAVLAGNGVDVGSGSALDIFGDTAALGMQDQLTIKHNALQEANTYRAQGANFQGESQMYNLNANSNGYLGGVAGTALSGIGSVAQKWYQYDQSGAFDSSSGWSDASYNVTNHGS